MQSQYVLDQRGTVHVVCSNDPGPNTLCCGQSENWRRLAEFPQGGALCEFCAAYMLPNVKVEGYHLPTLARLYRELGSPTDDNAGLASFMWRMSNRSCIPPSLAADFMRAAGYNPFQGYPLQRLKTPNLERVKQ
jgi:hypothetical protein